MTEGLTILVLAVVLLPVHAMVLSWWVDFGYWCRRKLGRVRITVKTTSS